MLGERVRQLITDHVADVSFFAPDTAYTEARVHLPVILERRGVSGLAALSALSALESVVRSIEVDLYRARRSSKLPTR